MTIIVVSCAADTEETNAVDPYCDYDHDSYQRASCGGNDCCDNDASAHPGAVGFSATATACGDFDFDCDGAEEQLWAETGLCQTDGASGCIGQDGWGGDVPACGVEEWFYDCRPAPVCVADIRLETQQCR